MSYSLLSGLKIIEVTAFVAAPLAGLTLAQLGAEVIRVDPVGGGIDRDRWPLAEDGTSLYWAGMNRAKRSVCLDLKTEQGQAVLHRLLQGGGNNGGIFLTNLTGPEWLSFERLRAVRPDLVMVDLKGHHDGATAVDYTVNAAVGVPFATGPEDHEGPINHMLPTWDAIAGLSLATALLAAIRARDLTGEAQHLSVALSDVAYALLGNIGVIADSELSGSNRPRIGNHVYGAFGQDLPTRDGRYVMVVVLTNRQWCSLLDAAGLNDTMAALEQRLGLDFSTDQGRWQGRKAIAEVLRSWSSGLDFAAVTAALRQHRVLWGPYQTFTQMLQQDPRASTQNPLIHTVDQPGVGRYRVPGSTIRVNGAEEGELGHAPGMGQDTRAVLREAGLSDAEVDQLFEHGIAGVGRRDRARTAGA